MEVEGQVSSRTSVLRAGSSGLVLGLVYVELGGQV